MFVVSRFGSLLFPAYRMLCRRVIALQVLVTSVVPFALWDVVVLLVVVSLVVAIVRRITGGHELLPFFTRCVLAASFAAFLFVGWALNHYAPPLSDEMGLEVGVYSVDDLATATQDYLATAASLALAVPRDDDGQLSKQDFYALAEVAGRSYAKLGDEYPIFQGPQAPVKALLVAGEPLLYSGHTGIFFAPTGESGVPLNCARADLPFIMCHEAAHRLAIASEKEANFAAFLACSASDDVRFAYAGYYNAFVYCFNALNAADSNTAEWVLDVVEDEQPEGVNLVLADLWATSEHYQAYQGPFQQVGTSVNDGYLRSFGEQVGVRSYGLVVDYLIAWQKRGL